MGAHGATMARPKAKSRMGKETHALRETETGQAKRRRRATRKLTTKQREEIPLNATMELFGANPTMGERQTLPDGTPTLYSGADLERLKVTLMVKSVAEGTNKTYSTGWRHWVEYRKGREKDPFLVGAEGEFQDEEEILNYVAYLVGALGRAYW